MLRLASALGVSRGQSRSPKFRFAVLSLMLVNLYAVAGLMALSSAKKATAAEESAIAPSWNVGVAKVDITPDEPVRLSGYASRTIPAVGIEDRLAARALVLTPAIADSQTVSPNPKPNSKEALVIVSIDAIGITSVMTEKILEKVLPTLGIPRSRIVFCTTHSHTAPHLEGLIPNLFGVPFPEAEHQAMLRTTQMMIDRISDVILKAFENQRPGNVEYGLGRAEFAINRRVLKGSEWVGIGTVDDGPVDRNVRVLKVTDPQGKLLAVSYQYACHSTSISPDANRISADWGGIAAGILEANHPDCVALPIIGCGADANPNPRGTIELSRKHGAEMAASVESVLTGSLKPLPPPSNAAFTLVALASANRPTPEKLKEMQNSGSAHERNFANTWLELLSRKDRIPETYPAPVHLWTFGKDLGWVFMGGEVVVDYQIRLEKELSQFDNVWVAGYVDDVFAYVASERVSREGGYEVDGSMLYYGQPGRWDWGTEDQIVDRVLQMTKQKILADQPRSPEDSLASIEVPEGWVIELVASEPLVTDPVGISFGTDGKVWVVEMSDYPLGGKSGCVKTLRDTDGDGKMDQATVFLDGLEYPAGLYAWRDGVVVACAPTVFFARDTDGDGKCDERVELVQGFPEGNPQHRVHGFTYGMDHRLHFGPGGGAEEVTVSGRGLLRKNPEQTMRILGWDLSLDPDQADLRLETGVTQYIRTTDEFGNWFGNENSLPMFHYLYPQRWMSQSGHFPSKRYNLMTDPPSIPPVYPLSQQADRFNDLYAINRFTSACSTIINRGAGQGEGMRGYALVCEPVHNLVTRYEITPAGVSWAARRIGEDAKSEFIRSSDPWFRPVRIENAPDGTLWVVDMYRYVIEHPEWIPEEWQRRINLRAGEDRGRIYRVRRKDFSPMPYEDFRQFSNGELLREIAGPNSARADLAQQIYIDRYNAGTVSVEELTGVQKEWIDASAVRTQVRLTYLLMHIGKIPQESLRNDVARLMPATLKVLLDQWHQLSESTEDSDLTNLRDSFLAGISPKVLKEHPDVALSYAVLASQAGDRFGRQIAESMAAGAKSGAMIEGIAFLSPNSIDAVLRSTLESKEDAINVKRMIEKLVGRCSPELKSQLLQTITAQAPANDNQRASRRPAWHFMLARQFSSADSSGLDNEAIERLLTAARESWDEYLKSSDGSNTGTLQAAMELLLSRMGDTWTEDHERFLAALTTGEASEIDSVVLRGLWRTSRDSWEKILDAWKKLSGESRTVTLLLASKHGVSFEQLLRRIQSNEISIDDVDVANLQLLRGMHVVGLDELKKEVLGDPPGSDRPEIVRGYLSRWPARIDPSVGQAAYRKHCAVCHDPRKPMDGNQDEQNHGEQTQEALAPNLRGLSHWTNAAWMTAILDPNRSVEEKYWVFHAKTDDGESITGLKLQEDDQTIEWVDSTGKISRVRKQDLAETRVSQRSLMPEGFETTLTPEEIAAIVSFLRSSSQDRN